MRASDWRHLIALALASATLGCWRNPAPDRWLPTATTADTDPYGAWVDITKVGGGDGVSGELLAVGRDSVFLLPLDGVVRTVPVDSVLKAVVGFYDSESSRLAGWTALGVLGTISNGWFLLLTLPTFAIGGSAATAAQSRAPIRVVEDAAAWDRVRMFARFPAGPPPDLPRLLPTRPRPLPLPERL